MSAIVMLYDPTSPPQAAEGQPPASLKPVQLSGATVGFIDNAKPNFNHLVDDLAALLTSQYGVKRIIIRRKTSASIPATSDVVEALANACDIVITGSGD
jgi:dTDP-4-amino-4,6-dideoxygalactose transaminase